VPRVRTPRAAPPPAVKPPPPPSEAPVAAAVVTGYVVRVQPSEDNSQVTLFIKLDQGGAITKGARGTLTLKDEVVSIVLSSVSNKNATAVVRLPPHKFTGNLVVKINAN
jgi:hypothetical protein